MVSVFAFYSDGPSLNTADSYNFLYEMTKIKKKEARVGPILKKFFIDFLTNPTVSSDKVN